MRFRLVFGSLFVLALVTLGFWTTAYYQIGKAQKDFISHLEAEGIDVTLVQAKTKGFPLWVERTADQVILRSKDANRPLFVQASNLAFSVSMLQPGRATYSCGEVKCSFDTKNHLKIGAISGTHTLDPTRAHLDDSVLCRALSMTVGGAEFFTAEKVNSVIGVRTGSLYFSCNYHNLIYPVLGPMGSHEKITATGYIDSPFSNWLDFSKAYKEQVVAFREAIDEAVRSGREEVPLFAEWISSIEEQQIAAHLTLDFAITSGQKITAKADIGIVDGMPAGTMTVTGEGATYEGVKKALQMPNEEKFDLAIRSDGIKLNGNTIQTFEKIDWETLPIATESVVCDTLKYYTHGSFRKLRAEQKKHTESADAQYAIGEGFLADCLYEDALVWFKRASQQQHPKALIHLAYQYFKGFGCEKNEELAREFAEDAVCQGITLESTLSEFTDNAFADWAVTVVGEK